MPVTNLSKYYSYLLFMVKPLLYFWEKKKKRMLFRLHTHFCMNNCFPFSKPQEKSQKVGVKNSEVLWEASPGDPAQNQGLQCLQKILEGSYGRGGSWVLRASWTPIFTPWKMFPFPYQHGL